MHTATNVVFVLSFMCSFTVLAVSRILSIFPNISSIAFYRSSLVPIIPPTDCNSPLNFSFSVNSLLSPFYKMLGKLRKRRVWPVGAVSNTITSKSIFQIELHRSKTTLSAGRKTQPRQYPELNSQSHSANFQYLRPYPNRKNRNLMTCSLQLQGRFPKYQTRYHCEQLINPFDRSGIFGNLLVEAVTQVVSRVSRNNDSLAASSSNCRRETAAGRCFTHSTLAPNENPMKTLLINDILKGPCKLLLHLSNNNTLSDIANAKIFNKQDNLETVLPVTKSFLSVAQHSTYESKHGTFSANFARFVTQIRTFSFNNTAMDPTRNMEDRTHKLLILVGDEGVEHEARDYKKLSEVIVNEYLSQNIPTFSNYLCDILLKVIRGIPLKSHFYASLTASISRQHSDLANRIIESVLLSVQSDLNTAKFNEALNSLNFLSESMNVSFFNSLALMNLLQDVLTAAQRQNDQNHRRGLVSVLVRGLPLCAHSLQEKIYHQFKKFIEKVYKMAEGDELCEHMYAQFAKNQITDYSAMGRLGQDFENLVQLQPKFKLHLDAKVERQNEWRQSESYKWERNDSDENYKNFKRREGAVNRSIVELLIDSFHSNWSILSLKVLNFIRSKSDPYSLKYLVESLVLKSLKSKRPIVEYSLLMALKINEITNASKLIEEMLLELFHTAQTFEMPLLISFAKLFSFIANNWREDFNWEGYTAGEELFLKRNALLRLILEKMMLLNDKFVCPQVLSKYEPSRVCTSEEEFQKVEELQTLEYFENALKNKTEAAILLPAIDSERKYEIFLEALLRRTSLSQTHLTVLTERYHSTLTHFKDYDWDLINKIRNFFRNSFFHRLLYLKLLIQRQVLAFSSYINYVGELKGKSDLEMIWIKMQLNELNAEFGKTLKFK